MGAGESDLETPTLIPTDGGDIISVSAGLYHSAFVTRDNKVYMCGTNATSCLTSQDDNLSPANGFKRLSSISERLEIVQIATGGDLMGAHTLAVSAHGRLYAWGCASACGQEPSDSDDTVDKPTLITEFLREDISSKREYIALERIAFASAGGSCSAVITTEGTLYTFGITAGGRLGHERTKAKAPAVQWRPKRVESLLGEIVIAVSAGGAHMLCVTRKGHLYAWGDNSKGQLGTGDFIDRFKPVRIPHPKNAAWAPIIAAGEGHSMAVDVNGRLWTWGGCGLPMLGQGSNQSTSVSAAERERALCASFQIYDVACDITKPNEVVSLADYRIARIGAGARHSIAVSVEGHVFSWGSRDQTGVKATSSVPRYLGVQRPAAVAAGSFHSFLLTTTSDHSSVLNFFADSLTASIPSHDCFVLTRDQGRVWLNSTIVRSRLSSIGWSTFIKPQLVFISDAPEENNSVTSLTQIADEIRSVTPGVAEQMQEVQNEYDRINKLMDEWIPDDVSGNPWDIPSDCLFTNMTRNDVCLFFRLVLLDEVPPQLPKEGSVDRDEILHALLRLSICAQFERGIALVKRLMDPQGCADIAVPKSSIAWSMDELYRQRFDQTDDVVRFRCAPPVYRDTVLGEEDLIVPVHAFILESLTHGTTEILQSQTPVDVMKELVFFWYHGKLNESESSTEMDLSQVFASGSSLSAVSFWANVASTARKFGSDMAACAAMDRLVSLLDSSNWKSVLDMIETIPDNRQVREAALLTGQNELVKVVLSHESFRLSSGYVYSTEELPERVSKVLPADISSELKKRVIEQIETQLGTTRKIKAKLDYYQSKNLDPVSGELLQKSQENPFQIFYRFFSSMFTSLRDGPSLASTGRDLAIAVAMIAVVTAAATVLPSKSLLRSNETFAKVVVVLVNFIFFSIAVYFFHRSTKRTKP